MSLIPFHAFAENDYAHPRPLQDALERGFRHLEADVFLLNNRLMVGNSILDHQSKGTVEELYFLPLKRLLEDTRYASEFEKAPLVLVLDFKSDGMLTYRALRGILGNYLPMLTVVRDGQVEPGKVTLILGGTAPREVIANENPRYVAIDGRYADLDSNAPTHLVPTISLRWGTYFRWTGKNEFQSFERARLNRMVERAHAQRRRIRFWSTPDVEIVWAALREAKVDLVGAQNYEELCRFFTPAPSPFSALPAPASISGPAVDRP